jgi:outer membrane protein TolC
MDRAVLLRRSLAGLCLACLPLAGCAGVSGPGAPASASPSLVHFGTPDRPEQPVKPISHEESVVPAPKEVPITLDAVLRIAEETNGKIGAAREKLHESQLEAEQAQSHWMPNVYAGVGYYRHEGGVQDFNGNLVHSSFGQLSPGVQLKTDWNLREITYRKIDAERKVWQQKAELSQVDNEVLLEAATTYVDLLTARRAEALSHEIQRYEQKILERTERLAKVEASYDAVVYGLKSAIASREHQAAQLRQQGDAASAKLVYLLGLPPLTCLVPVDPVLVPVQLIDVSMPPKIMVERALTTGPGVQELVGLLNTIQAGLDMSYSKKNLLPSVEVCVWEGLIAAGPGATLNTDNRLDACLQLKWDLTAMLRAEDQRKLVRSKIEQTRWTLKDVKDRLASGVQEARQTILDSREMLGHSMTQIQEASKQYQKSDDRVEKGVPGATPSEVVTAIRALEQAHFNYVQATRDHNKAQVRLLLLVGHPPAQEKKLAPPVSLPAPEPLKGKRELPDADRDDKKGKDGKKGDELLPPPKGGMSEWRPAPKPDDVRTMRLIVSPPQ